jgi:hypothetical protein
MNALFLFPIVILLFRTGDYFICYYYRLISISLSIFKTFEKYIKTRML